MNAHELHHGSLFVHLGSGFSSKFKYRKPSVTGLLPNAVKLKLRANALSRAVNHWLNRDSIQLPTQWMMIWVRSDL